MNKLVKASVAAAAGIALLMGGAGSLALWNDSASVSSGSVSSGRLTLTPGTGAWGKNSGAGVALWVPGNTDTYTQTFTITATGDQMSAQIAAAYTGVATQGFTSSSVITVAGQTPSSPGVYTLSAGTYTATVVVTVAFNATGTANQNVTVPLGNVAVTLTQVAPAN